MDQERYPPMKSQNRTMLQSRTKRAWSVLNRLVVLADVSFDPGNTSHSEYYSYRADQRIDCEHRTDEKVKAVVPPERKGQSNYEADAI
jgi:hypothetical protein